MFLYVFFLIYEAAGTFSKKRQTATCSIKNKQNLEANTLEAQEAFRVFLSELMEDQSRARDYMMRVSMISSLREARRNDYFSNRS